MDKYKDDPIINDAFEVIGDFFQKTQQELVILHDANQLYCQQVEQYQEEIAALRQESQEHRNELVLLRDQNQTHHRQMSEFATVIDSLRQQLQEVQRDNQHLKETLQTPSTQSLTRQDLPNTARQEDAREYAKSAARQRQEALSAIVFLIDIQT